MSEESSAAPRGILPIAIEQGILEGKGLTQGDMSEFEDSDNITQGEDGSAGFSMHTFHTGKIMVAVYEAERVRSTSTVLFMTSLCRSSRGG